MEHAASHGAEREALEASRSLWLLLTAIGAADQESERARLVATGIPSLLACTLSGLGLRDEAYGRWDLVLHREEQPGSSSRAVSGATEQELSQLLEEAIQDGLLCLTHSEPGSHAQPIPPYWANLGVGLLAVVPVRTLRRPYGILIVGRAGSKRLSREEEWILHTLAEHLAISVEKQRAEAALQASEERYRTLYNNTPVMLHSIDSHGTLVNVNEHWLHVMGYERTEVLGRQSVDFLTESSRRRALEVTLPQFWKTGVARDVEYQMVKKDGAYSMSCSRQTPNSTITGRSDTRERSWST